MPQSIETFDKIDKAHKDMDPLYILEDQRLNRSNSESQPLIDRKRLVCVSNKKGTDYCINSRCKHHAIYCADQNCKCHRNHNECIPYSKIQKINGPILKKIKSTDLGPNIGRQFSEMSENIRQTSLYFNERLKNFGLTSEDRNFIEKISLDKSSKDSSKIKEPVLTGKFIHEYLEMRELKKNQFKNEMKEELVNQIQRAKRAVNLKLDKILQFIEYEFKPEQHRITFPRSTIITSKQQICQMNDFMKDIDWEYSIKTELIYQGTADGASREQFHEKVKHKSNLLYLVENEHGYKYGGFCPTPITIEGQGEWIIDETKSSFVFSLNGGKKIPIKNDYQIMKSGWKEVDSRNHGRLLCFGGVGFDYNLMISANSMHSQRTNFVSLSGPKNSHQGLINVPSFVECNGIQSERCQLKQIEVFKIDSCSGRGIDRRDEEYRMYMGDAMQKEFMEKY